MSLFDLDKHIEKKIPFAYQTKEGETVIVFPAEKRFSLDNVSVVMKSEMDFDTEIGRIKQDHKNFQSLR